MLRIHTILAASALLAATPAAAQTVYSNNFDAPATVSGGVVASLTGPNTVGTVINNSYGFSGSFLRNESIGNPAGTTLLSLSNLASHTSVSVSFLLAFLDSWDSSNGSPAPDLLEILIDGTPVLQGLTAANASGNAFSFGGGTLLGQNIQMDERQFFNDTVVDMSTASALTFAHTGSTLTIGIRAYGAGWQGGTDESWGIDNLTVTLRNDNGAVPEPATWVMMMAGFGLIGGALRRRTRKITVRYA